MKPIDKDLHGGVSAGRIDAQDHRFEMIERPEAKQQIREETRTIYRKGDPIPASVLLIEPADQVGYFGVDVEVVESAASVKVVVLFESDARRGDVVFRIPRGVTVTGKGAEIDCNGAAGMSIEGEDDA